MEPHIDLTDSAAGAMEEDDFDRVDDWPVSAAEAQTAGAGIRDPLCGFAKLMALV